MTNWTPSNILAMVETVRIAALGRRRTCDLPDTGWMGGHSMISGWTGMPGTPHGLLLIENTSLALGHSVFTRFCAERRLREPLVRSNSKCYNSLKRRHISYVRFALI
jgi:hypothetical protein